MTHWKGKEEKHPPHPRIVISHAEPHVVAGIRFCAQFLNPDIEVVQLPGPTAEQSIINGSGKSSPAGQGITEKKRNNTQIPQLTTRQYQVLENLMQGKTNKEIARTLGISPATVRIHVSAVMRTLGVTTRAAAAVIAAEELRSWRG